MKRLALLTALFAAACSSNKEPLTPSAAGKAYFVQAGCASCHRVGQDGSAVGPDLSLVGFRHSAEWLDLFIKDPQAWKKDTLMPNRRVSDAARAAIVAYLSEQKGQGWERGGKPWSGVAGAEKGRVIYNRAGCVGCHGTDGGGGYPNNNVPGGLIPKLNTVFETYTKAELVKKIAAGVPKPLKKDAAGPEPLVWMPSWKEKLDEAEIAAVADYLMTLRPPGGESSESSF